MLFVNQITRLLTKSNLERIDKVRCRSIELQEFEFSRLMSSFAQTQYGKQHRITSGISIEKFQSVVPLNFYADLKSLIEEMIKGKSCLLWNQKVHCFAKSSGTSGEKSKYIPVSPIALKKNHFCASKDLLALYFYTFPKSKLFDGKGITLGGSQQKDFINTNTFIGDLSSILISHTPLFYDIFRIPTKKEALLPDFEKKIELIYKQSKNKNITHFMGVPSWNLILMQRILEYAGKQNLLQLWKNLELFIHGGVSFTPYREEYKKIIPSENMRYIETYNASEGFFAFQDDYSQSGMLLLTAHGIFYEFISMDTFNTDNKHVVTLHDVKLNTNYAVVITTNSGLYRYIIGDTVKFVSLSPYRLIITGRTQHYINTFGEEVMVDNAEKALEKACKITRATVKEYTVAPVFMQDKTSGRHQWLIEFNQSPVDINQFRLLLDSALCELNSDYEAKRRNNITLQMLELIVLPTNTFYNFYKQQNKLGGQNKVPRLSNDRKVVESILTYLNQNQ